MDWDDAYANLPYIPGAEAMLTRWSDEAASYRDALTQQGCARLGILYGDRPREAYDLFFPEGAGAGLCVFVHGGYWMKFHRDLWSHFAEGMRAAGWCVAVPSYDLCPDVTIADITGQIATAIGHAASEVAGPIHLAGHSAGGQLVARMCVEGVLAESVARRIEMVMPISPVSDLRPLIRTQMNNAFRLTEDSATAESPALQQPLAVPVSVWVGGAERPVFLDQARWLAEAWGAGHVVAAGQNHLTMIEPLREPASAMVKTLANPPGA